MPVCDPALNAPPPAGVRLLTDAELTPEMQTWAKGYANDLRVPYWTPSTGAGSFRKWFGNVPIVALVLCHSYTVIGQQTIPGAYHGVTLFRAIDPAWYPVEVTTANHPGGPDWTLVAESGAAIGLVVGAFFLALRAVGPTRARVAHG